MADCLFCKLIAGDIPSKKIYEDDRVLVFHDIAPQAPTHLLAIPKQHIASLSDASDDDAPLLGHLLTVVARLSKELGWDGGFRLVVNTGKDAGQTVPHLHFQLLAGRAFGWPPG